MSHTVELELAVRWRVRATWTSGASSDLIFDTDEAMQAWTDALRTDPGIQEISCSRHRDLRSASPSRPTRRTRRPWGRRRNDPDTMLRSAAQIVFKRVEELHRGSWWPMSYVPYEQRAYQAVQAARAVLADSPDASLDVLLTAVTPILDQVWPRYSPATNEVADAVEELAAVVQHVTAAKPQNEILQEPLDFERSTTSSLQPAVSGRHSKALPEAA